MQISKLLVLLIALVFINPSYAGDCKEEQKKKQGYDVTIIVEYKNITLQDLAEKEKEIEKVFKGTDVEIKFKHNCPSCESIWSSYITTDSATNITKVE